MNTAAISRANSRLLWSDDYVTMTKMSLWQGVQMMMAILDYRTRTAAERRERMSAHLIRTAMGLYAQHGFAGLAIDEVTRAAGVARGTFYNYFRSSDELLAVSAATLSDALMRIVDPLVNQYADPAERVSCGVRTCLQVGAEYPQVAAFISRGGPAALADSQLLREYLSRDLTDGIASGRFQVMELQLAFDLVVGVVVAGFHSMMTGTVSADYIPDLTLGILQSLGIARGSARRLSRLPLPPIVVPPHSIIVQ